MKCIINNQVVLSRAPEGPLAAQIGSFAESVNKQGYRLASIHRRVGWHANFFSRGITPSWRKKPMRCLRAAASPRPGRTRPARYRRYRAA
jgi:hypothetical protein